MKGLSLVFLLLFVSLSNGAVAPWEIEEIMNKPAPQFTLSDMDGREISLSSFNGKVIIINFWATWCPPCKAEMPSLDSLYREFRNSGLEVIAVSVDRSKDDIKDFLRSRSLEFIILHDKELRVSRDYKVYAYPTSFIIDRKGILREKFIGEVDWLSEEMKRTVKGYLSQ